MLIGQSSKETFNGLEEKDDLDIMDGDILKSVMNGMPSISFSDRIHKILIQGMENTMILKLLSRNIGFSVLQNKLYNLWRLSAPLHMMDIENGYFLMKFQNKLDCEMVLSEGPWIIFGQYLTVQLWTLAFDSTQAYPSVVMAWIRFPGDMHNEDYDGDLPVFRRYKGKETSMANTLLTLLEGAVSLQRWQICKLNLVMVWAYYSKVRALLFGQIRRMQGEKAAPYKTLEFQRVYLKDLMEHLAESISALSNSYLGNGTNFESGVQKGGVNVPGQ
ncbi:hypothetical protein J1N35_017670 [Gossypium stocksii]|uniref:DUF4283 domain-containing protein n=1 Tax=Gossypium stocksii TaxID=47602 RepID=A0A9D4A5Y3_9ROSI|nr:hypothetical protein J1N35_017670 [Gossypium stocksii]